MPTNFSAIGFDPEQHRYFIGDRELTGITRKLKELQKPFDRIGNANRVAAREGRAVEAVLAEWDAKGERSRVLGTAVHDYIKVSLLGNGVSIDPFLSLNTKMYDEFTTFDNFWMKLSLKTSYLQEHVEWIIGDEELGLAGTLDTMLFSSETGLYHIWDWKTGSFDTYNKFQNLLHPFSHLDACKLHIYSLQVSLYRLIVERNTNLILGDSYIVHLTPTAHQVYKAVDLRAPLLAWLQGAEYVYQ